MARVLLRQGQDARAVEEFRQALRLDPENYQFLAALAGVLASDANADIRDGPAALACAARANVLSDGKDPTVLDALGMACAVNGDFTNAVAVTSNAIALAQSIGMNSTIMQQHLARDLAGKMDLLSKGSPKTTDPNREN